MKSEIPKFDIPDDRCELCVYYEKIDSALGYCKRFPPKWEEVKEKWYSKKVKTLIYLIVLWGMESCAEYIMDKSLKWEEHEQN